MRVNHWLYGAGTVEREYAYQGKRCFLVRFDRGCVVDLYARQVTA